MATSDPELTELATKFTVKQYHELASKGDRTALGAFLIRRFDERYFAPMTTSKRLHGFTLLSIACMMIETLEAFYQGRRDTNGVSRRMFQDFFKRHPSLESFLEDGDWFYSDIRCALLHQSETYGGWRIKQTGPLLDKNLRIINAKKFIIELQKAVSNQAVEMEHNDVCWNNFKRKMAEICANCVAS